MVHAYFSRRQWLKSTLSGSMAVASMPFTSTCVMAADTPEVVDVGSRLELFVDGYLIDRIEDGARLRLHHPEPREIAKVHDKPWEGNSSGYTTVFQDGDLYRMYHRGAHLLYPDGKATPTHPAVTCYAESRDGIHWTRPELGLFEFEGSKANNIVWDGVGSHNFTPFKDPNPGCKPEARYKAVGGLKREGGLFAFQSADAIHWALVREKPVITKGAFDSQNVAFWDAELGEYRAYVRDFRNGRDIRTCTSKNFLDWSEPAWVEYTPGRVSQLYTNNVLSYHRAPHLCLGFPMRYVDHGWAPSTKQLPQPEYRRLLANRSRRTGTAFTDTMFISSRDRRHFHVWPESFVRPGIQRPGSWFYGDSSVSWGVVETKSLLEGAPNELSFYVAEAARQPEGRRLRRYALRLDGFVSIEAPLSGGDFISKPLRFDGTKLALNFSTSAAGSIRVGLQDKDGKDIEGYTLADCHGVYGDDTSRVVAWKNGTDVSKLAGKPVRLRMNLKDANVFAFRFGCSSS